MSLKYPFYFNWKSNYSWIQCVLIRPSQIHWEYLYPYSQTARGNSILSEYLDDGIIECNVEDLNTFMDVVGHNKSFEKTSLLEDHSKFQENIISANMRLCQLGEINVDKSLLDKITREQLINNPAPKQMIEDMVNILKTNPPTLKEEFESFIDKSYQFDNIYTIFSRLNRNLSKSKAILSPLHYNRLLRKLLSSRQMLNFHESYQILKLLIQSSDKSAHESLKHLEIYPLLLKMIKKRIYIEQDILQEIVLKAAHLRNKTHSIYDFVTIFESYNATLSIGCYNIALKELYDKKSFYIDPFFSSMLERKHFDVDSIKIYSLYCISKYSMKKFKYLLQISVDLFPTNINYNFVIPLIKKLIKEAHYYRSLSTLAFFFKQIPELVSDEYLENELLGTLLNCGSYKIANAHLELISKSNFPTHSISLFNYFRYLFKFDQQLLKVILCHHYLLNGSNLTADIINFIIYMYTRTKMMTSLKTIYDWLDNVVKLKSTIAHHKNGLISSLFLDFKTHISHILHFIEVKHITIPAPSIFFICEYLYLESDWIHLAAIGCYFYEKNLLNQFLYNSKLVNMVLFALIMRNEWEILLKLVYLVISHNEQVYSNLKLDNSNSNNSNMGISPIYSSDINGSLMFAYKLKSSVILGVLVHRCIKALHHINDFLCNKPLVPDKTLISSLLNELICNEKLTEEKAVTLRSLLSDRKLFYVGQLRKINFISKASEWNVSPDLACVIDKAIFIPKFVHVSI